MNRYKNALSRVADNPEVERSALTVPDAPPIEREMNPFARFAAIAMASAILFAGAAFAWQYMHGDRAPDSGGTVMPGMTGVTEETPGVTPETQPSSAPVPFNPFIDAQLSQAYSIDYRVFFGKWDSDMSMEPKTFTDADTLRAFINGCGIREGQGFGDERECGLPGTVDFSQKTVVAVYDFDLTKRIYSAPILETDYSALPASGILLSLNALADPGDLPAGAGTIRGYFLIFDRDYANKFSNAGGMAIRYDSRPYDFDGVRDLTPETLRGITGARVFEGEVRGFSTDQYPGPYTGAFVEQPHLIMHAGFGCTGLYAAEDLSYIILTYTYPNATQPIETGGYYDRSLERKFASFQIMWLGEETQFYYSGEYYGHDLMMEPLGGGKWAIYDETGRHIRNMNVTRESVSYESP